MALTKADLQTIMALVGSMLNEVPVPSALGGMSIDGTYNPADGTHQVKIGDTDAAYDLAVAMGDADVTQLLPHPMVPHATHDPNDQYGPRGGEQTVLLPSQSGFASVFVAQPQDGNGKFPSIGAPAGERWLCHRNAAGAIDAYFKLTNDGPTAGDQLGGIIALVGALFSLATAGGLMIVADDSKGTLSLGATGLDGDDGVVRKSDLKSALDSLASNIKTWATTNFQSGTSTPPSIPEATITASAAVLSKA